jgi:hypothetical protein
MNNQKVIIWTIRFNARLPIKAKRNSILSSEANDRIGGRINTMELVA